MKEDGIYRKLAAMALTLPWLVAAVVLALGGGSSVWAPAPRWVDDVVVRVVNDTAKMLAVRRGVRVTRPLTVQVVDRSRMAEARDAAIQSITAGRNSGSQETLRQAMLDHMGLMSLGNEARSGPAGSDATTPREVTGLYDLDHARLLVAGWADLAAGRFAWTQDVALALLDRQFSLTGWLAEAPAPAKGAAGFDSNNSDALLARQAVAQGDAAVLTLEALDPEAELPSERALAGMAAQVRDSLTAEAGEGVPSWDLQRRLFIQLDGLMFVAHFRERLPWRGVDEVWRHPPASSEQVLHPEKYERAETPDDVGRRVPAQLHARWRVVYRDTLGEWGVRQFLSRSGDTYRAARAAAGWGGDRALLLRSAHDATDESVARANGDDSFVAWVTTWDDETDAADFAAEAAQALTALAGASPMESRLATGKMHIKDAAGRVFALQHRGRAVGLLLAAPSATGDLLPRLTAAAAAVPAHRVVRASHGQGRGGTRPR